MAIQRRIVITEAEPIQQLGNIFEISFIENTSEKYAVRIDMSEKMLDLVRYWLEHDDVMFLDLYDND